MCYTDANKLLQLHNELSDVLFGKEIYQCFCMFCYRSCVLKSSAEYFVVLWVAVVFLYTSVWYNQFKEI